MNAQPHLVLVVHSGADATPRLVEALPEHPQLSIFDLAASRGDGIFETYSVARGTPHAVEAHLTRFERSARMLDLPLPDRDVWREGVLAIAERLADHDEAWVRTVLSRGIEGHTLPTGWVYGAPSPDFRSERTVGLRVALLDRGYRSDVASTSPWLLTGAKTLSYAVNRAAVREAHRRGADDVVFVSSDGFLLEGPTSTLVVRHGDRLSTPPADFGILLGTTQSDLFAAAGDWGLSAHVEPLTAEQLRNADAAWLVSSVRHAAPIRAVDDVDLAVDSALTATMNGFLNARRT